MISLESYKNLGQPVCVSGVFSPDLYTSPLSLEAVMILVYRQIWKRITDFPDYEVSNYGQVKSFKMWNGCRNPLILKQAWSGAKHSKYLIVGLSNKKTKTKRVHILVLESFKGKRPPGMEGCHNNGKRWDNSVWNVRWDTSKNNHADMKKHGTINTGERNGLSKLKDSEVIEIRRLKNKGLLNNLLGKMFKVTESTIAKIIRNETWAHITDELLKEVAKQD